MTRGYPLFWIVGRQNERVSEDRGVARNDEGRLCLQQRKAALLVGGELTLLVLDLREFRSRTRIAPTCLLTHTLPLRDQLGSLMVVPL
jgi:hypothetical protein